MAHKLDVEDIQYLDDKYADKIKEQQHNDTESGHILADGLLCDLLTELGFTDTVKAFKTLRKWYA